MTWKKTWFSYVLWVCYAALVCGCIGGSAYMAAVNGGAVNQSGIVSVAAGVFAAGGILYAALYFGQRRRTGRRFAKTVWLTTEALLIVGLLAAGMLLRQAAFPVQTGTNSYYDIAQVTQGGQITPIAHGALYYYILLLHGLFTFVGNKWGAGIILQIVLQLMAAVLLYVSVRKMAGAFAGVWTFGFLMLAPFSIRQSFTYGPEMLYLVLYAFGLYLLTGYLNMVRTGRMKKWYHCMAVLLLGIYISFLMYLDILGITLIAVGIAAVWLNVEQEHDGQRAMTGKIACLVLLAGVFAGILGIFFADAMQSGSAMQAVMNVWEWLFTPMGFAWQGLCVYPGEWSEMAAVLILAVGLVMGIFSFFQRRKTEKQSVWILLAVLSGGMTYVCRADANMSRTFLWFLYLTVLSGMGAGAAFELTAEKDDTDSKMQVKKELEEIELPEDIKAETPKVRLLENPLPLPKKHVKKTMEYKVEPSEEQMHYDVDVKEDDDFDL